MNAPFNGREKSAGRHLFCQQVASGFLFFAAAGATFAADASGVATNTPTLAALPNTGSALFSLFRVLGALALVFAVFFGGLWIFRNWQQALRGKGVVARLNIVETRSLGQRHALIVVGYDQQRFLIASSPAGVTMLANLPESAVPVANAAVAPATKPSFSEALRLALQGKR